MPPKPRSAAPERDLRGPAHGGVAARGAACAALVAVASAIALLAWPPGHGAPEAASSPVARVADSESGEISDVLNASEQASRLYFGEGAPFRLFTRQGVGVSGLDEVEPNATLFRVRRRRGLHFQWPAAGELNSVVEIEGVEPPTERPIRLELLSRSPRVFLVHDFLSDGEAEELKANAVSEANPYKMRRSTTGTESWTQEGESQVSSVRTSDNAFDIDSPTAQRVMRRAFEVLRIPFRHSMADGIQIVRYRPGQAYIAHHDYFDAGSAVQDGEYDFDSSREGGGNRLATLFLYLSDVEEGGQTVFPRSHSAAPGTRGVPPSAAGLFEDGSWESDMVTQCYSAFSVTPRKGAAILFYSQHLDGTLDPASLHGGCPVLRGVKWAANLWVWNRCRYGMRCRD